MRKYVLGIFGLSFILLSFLFVAYKNSSVKDEKQINIQAKPVANAFANFADHLYHRAKLDKAGLNFTVFEKALTGYYNLNSQESKTNKPILTIADFDQLSTRKRLYVIDLEQERLLMNTWVAHGQRSGEDKTVRFSNQNDSFSSSIGFYITAEEYQGKHGRSLKLDGMDPGYNDNARSRSIVIHGAAYVSEGTIEALGRLGRSQGCPAVPTELSDLVISTLGSGSVLFINKSDQNYHSVYLNQGEALLAANLDQHAPGHTFD